MVRRAATVLWIAVLAGCAAPQQDVHEYAALVGWVASSPNATRLFDDAADRLGPEFGFWYYSSRHRHSLPTKCLGLRGFEFAAKKLKTPVAEAHRALRDALDAHRAD